MSPVRALRSRLPVGEAGFTIIEVVVALMLLALASVAFSVTTGNGLRLVGTSQERQSATQIANQWMEQARVIPVDGLGLPDDTVFEGAGTPDEALVGTQYDAGAGLEELVFVTGSTFGHIEEETVNNIDYVAYRYVTWVPDGADPEAYKRVTVVVQWSGTSTDGVAKRVTLSSIMAGDGIAWSATTSTSTSSTSSTSTTTTSTTSTTAPPAVCDGDSTAPSGSMSILAGSGALAGYTSSSTVTVSLSASDPCTPLTMAFSNDGSTFSTPVAFDASAVWTLESGNGARTMWARIADANGNSATTSGSVIVDGSKPTTPGAFTATVKSSPKRVELTWTVSTDNDGVIGYRIYVATGAGSFQNQATGVAHPCPTTPCTWTHAGVKNRDTYTYYVVAYDAAGNESDATSHLTRTI